MKIIICLKQVIDTGIEYGFGKINDNLINKNLIKILNPDDAGSLHLALQMKMQYKDTEIIAVSIGDSEVDCLLRDVLAMGVNKAIRITFPGLFEPAPFQKSLILSRVISMLSPDIVTVGCHSLDKASGLTGPYVSAILGYVFIYGVSSITYSPEEQKFTVTRSFRKGLDEKLSFSSPAIIAVRYIGNELPYPSIDRILESRLADLTCLCLEDLGILPDMIKFERIKASGTSFHCPETRYTPFDSSLPAFERILSLLKGGISRRAGQFHTGSREEMVNTLFNILLEREILKSSKPQIGREKNP